MTALDRCVAELHTLSHCVHRLVRLDPAAEGRLIAAGKAGLYAITASPARVGGIVMRVEDGLYMAAACTYGAAPPPFNDAQLVPFLDKVRECRPGTPCTEL